MNTFFFWIFRIHDDLAFLIAKRLLLVKKSLLVLAHAALIGGIFLVSVSPPLRRDFGEVAANLLIVILFISPLSVIVPIRLLKLGMALRRELGILMAYLALVHVYGYFADPDVFDPLIRPYLSSNFFDMYPPLLFGFLGTLGLLPLLFTSNALANRLLGAKKWKLLHRLVYPTFLAIIVHRFFMVGGGESPLRPFLEAALLLGSYLFLKYCAAKQWFPWSRFVLPYVSGRYDAYRKSAEESPLSTVPPVH